MQNTRLMVRRLFEISAFILILSTGVSAVAAQPATPAVGVIAAARTPVTEGFEFIGRVQAIERVALVARVSAFLVERLFTEGADVKKGDLLYRLERGPYEADLAVKQAGIAQAQATLTNAGIALARAKELQEKGSGTQAALDNALEQERNAAAQLKAAQAQALQSEINLGYTEIHAPISGRIGRTAATVGNVVGPNSGTLATIVSQDPMYVTFSIPVPTAVDMRNRYAQQGFDAMNIKLRLPDNRIYGQVGKLGFVDISVSEDTDTITLRGTIPNPLLPGAPGMQLRELSDGQFVTVLLESVIPVEQISIPREAVLSDQRGEFVYVVGADNRTKRRGVKLGQSRAGYVVVTDGLKEGERVVLEGIQRVQAEMLVAPAPADVADPNVKR